MADKGVRGRGFPALFPMLVVATGLALASPADAQDWTIGPCTGGNAWASITADGFTQAVLGPCEAPHENYLSLTCGFRSDAVRLALNLNVDGNPGAPMIVGFAVDGRKGQISGRGFANEYLGGTSFEAMLFADDPLIEALAAGSTVTVTAPGLPGPQSFALTGSRAALSTLSPYCEAT